MKKLESISDPYNKNPKGSVFSMIMSFFHPYSLVRTRVSAANLYSYELLVSGEGMPIGRFIGGAGIFKSFMRGECLVNK